MRRKLTEAAAVHAQAQTFVASGTTTPAGKHAGTCTLTVRLQPDLYQALRLAAVKRSAAGQTPDTQQAIVAAALQAWLADAGHL